MTRRLLVVDDDDGIRLIASRALQKLTDWEVRTAVSGAEALEHLDGGADVDAVLLDVMMPGMDGPTTLARLRERPATSSLPVVLLTAKVQDSDLRELERLPVSGVLAKPFDPLTLHQQVAAVLGWTDG